MAIFFAWIALAVIVWIVASRRGRIGFGWFLLSLLVSPVITGPLVLVLPRRYADAQTGASGGGILFGIFKGLGLAILVVGVVVLAMMAISLVAIIQHGGA